MIASLAVASRITPLRCRFPLSSTKPLGSVNSNSVLNAIALELLRGLLGGRFLSQNLSPEGPPDSPGIPRGQGKAGRKLKPVPLSRVPRPGLAQLPLLEHQVEGLGGMARRLGVQRRPIPLGGVAVEQVEATRLLTLVVVED